MKNQFFQYEPSDKPSVKPSDKETEKLLQYQFQDIIIDNQRKQIVELRKIKDDVLEKVQILRQNYISKKEKLNKRVAEQKTKIQKLEAELRSTVANYEIMQKENKELQMKCISIQRNRQEWAKFEGAFMKCSMQNIILKIQLSKLEEKYENSEKKRMDSSQNYLQQQAYLLMFKKLGQDKEHKQKSTKKEIIEELETIKKSQKDEQRSQKEKYERIEKLQKMVNDLS